ncbi:hypothetical protein ACKAV7_001648 [Fusarium commune]
MKVVREKDGGEEESDEEYGEDEQKTPKNNDEVQHGHASDSVVTLSPPESEAETEPSPGSEADDLIRTLRSFNILFFDKEHPQKFDKNGVRLEILVYEIHLRLACDTGLLRSKSRSVLEASDYGWDAIAMAIVVNSIHGQYQYMPLKIDLELFVKIAVITDYFQCDEALSMAAEIWRSNIYDHETVDRLNSTCLMWFYISWVFGLGEVFQSTTKMVVMGYQGPESLEMNSLPLQGFLGKLDDKRIGLLGQIKQGLEDLRNTLSTERFRAARNSYSCPPLTLGSLVQMMHGAENDQDSPLIAPFHMWSVSQVVRMVQLWPKPIPFHHAYKRFGSRFVSPNNGQMYPCSIKGRTVPVFDNFEQAIQNLRFADFQG